MDLPDSALSMFSARVARRNGSAVVEIPEQELDVGPVREGQVYRVALLPAPAVAESGGDAPRFEGTEPSSTPGDSRSRRGDGPPVEEGDVREVEIEDIGEQGDGIARIGPGYVVFVPDTDVGDRVRIRIDRARENFAFAEILESEQENG